MYFKRIGNREKPTILFLHALGANGSMWNHVMESLKTEFHCIAVDLPGHGLSAQTSWKSFPDLSSELYKLIKSESAEGKAHIVGLSFGAYAGLELATNYPDCVSSALLSGINVLPLPGKLVMKAMNWFISKMIKTDFMISMNARMLKIPLTDIPAYRQSLKQLNTKSYYKANIEAIDFTMPNLNSSYNVRLLFIAGQREHRLILDSLSVLCQLSLNARAYIVKDVGHAWSAENPDLFALTIGKWINDMMYAGTYNIKGNGLKVNATELFVQEPGKAMQASAVDDELFPGANFSISKDTLTLTYQTHTSVWPITPKTVKFQRMITID